MSRYKFLCSSCGVQLVVPQEVAGQIVTCSSCRAKIRVPSPEQARRREEAVAALERPAVPLKSISFLRAVAALLIVGGAVNIVAGIVVTANTSLAYPVFAGLGVALSSFWMAALTYAAISVVRNIYGIHKKIDDKLSHLGRE